MLACWLELLARLRASVLACPLAHLLTCLLSSLRSSLLSCSPALLLPCLLASLLACFLLLSDAARQCILQVSCGEPPAAYLLGGPRGMYPATYCGESPTANPLEKISCDEPPAATYLCGASAANPLRRFSHGEPPEAGYLVANLLRRTPCGDSPAVSIPFPYPSSTPISSLIQFLPIPSLSFSFPLISPTP